VLDIDTLVSFIAVEEPSGRIDAAMLFAGGAIWEAVDQRAARKAKSALR
jgi:hypothetical protein